VSLLLLSAAIMVVNGRDAEMKDVRVGDEATVTCIIMNEGPWGVTSLEIARSSDDGPGGGSSGGDSGTSGGKSKKNGGWTW
jgi:hypothetical protein